VPSPAAAANAEKTMALGSKSVTCHQLFSRYPDNYIPVKQLASVTSLFFSGVLGLLV